MKSIWKPIQIILACIFILIGLIGLLIPVFPTVPFLFIAAIILGKKPKEVIYFFKYITKRIKLQFFRIKRRLKKKFVRRS
ncbi:MAG: hypothetical protein Q4F95_04785 [Oscillospiraceae bacterium]|nr:hypothetical protein [Oscillospiraceae bacterium]